jgi:LysM repeat protein
MLSLKNSCLLLTLSLACCYTLFSQGNTANVSENKKMTVPQYIERFSDVAIREMERSRIPASITLAQGIHESGCGSSRLAIEANNHFGIKCHNWSGESFYAWDDDPVQSCFRKYPNAELSYIDHTNFLSKGRYLPLFEHKLDYEKWAHGLKSCGYATDPEYAQKIIEKIQKYKLYEFDLALPQINPDSLKISPEIKPEEIYVTPQNLSRKLRKQTRSALFPAYKKGFFQQNGITYAIARKNETALEVAARFDIPYRKFLTFNDLVDGDLLIENQYCYLNNKKFKYKGNEIFHKVSNYETMYEIAQYYGLKLQVLLERNLLVEGQEPKNGESIILNEKAQKAPELRDPNVQPTIIVKSETPKEVKKSEISSPKITISEVPAEEEEDLVANDVALDTDVPMYADMNTSDPVNTIMNYENKSNENLVFPASEPENFTIEQETKTKELSPVLSSSKKNTLEKENMTDNTPNNYIMHKVAAHETLFSIGKKYSVDYKKIMEINQLNSQELNENQLIKIPNK